MDQDELLCSEMRKRLEQELDEEYRLKMEFLQVDTRHPLRRSAFLERRVSNYIALGRCFGSRSVVVGPLWFGAYQNCRW